ncbi:MAG TPA: AAA family ATPase [Spongiibacteraceae bacterium]|jgi:general secretion pathway protein A
MYNHHFGLAEAPFSIAPDPRYLYLSEQHREALAHLVYGIGDHGGFVVLTGEVGTGKTTVCRCLLQQVPEHIDIAVIVNPKLNAHELLQTICEELGVASTEDVPTSKQLLDALNLFLLATHARGRNAILIVDEAQNLSPDVLEQLRLLTNLETNQRKLLQLILLGQPELNTLLAQPSLRQLAQRITARYHLRPLARNEVTSYIEHRLAVAGGRGHLFSGAAIVLIYRYSKGIPRLINLLCDRALLGVYAQSGSAVDIAMVRRAAVEVLPPRAFGINNLLPRRVARIATAIIAGAVIAGAIYFLQHRFSNNVAVASSASAQDWRSVLERSAADKASALRELFQLWNADAAPIGATDCAIASAKLNCVALHAVQLDDLRRYNVPVVLELQRSDSAALQFVVLKRLQSSQAQIDFAGGSWQVAWADIAKWWRGDVLLLVPAPIAQLPLQPGASGDLIAWFDEQLYRHFHRNERRWLREVYDSSDKLTDGAAKQAWLASHYLALQQAPAAEVYDAALFAQIKRFQQEQGLPDNGVIDLHTVLALGRLADASQPLLATAAQKQGS